MRWILLCLLAAMAPMAGCARPRNAAAPPGPPSSPGPAESAASPREGGELIVTPRGIVAGKVTLVNRNARYVVVSYPIGVVPEIGRRLNAYRSGLKVGEIKISGPHRDVNTVADILAGECQVGDEVRED
jgi:hypothetical protein